MSTRAAIARIDGDGWKGIFHHWDGYPSGLGKDIWNLVRGKFQGDIEAFLHYAIEEHPGGWEVISEGSFNDPEEFGEAFLHGCECHQKPYVPSRDVRKPLEEGASCDPLFLEWIYILDPKSRSMTILSHQNRGQGYMHFIVDIVSFDEPEPDWEEIRCQFCEKESMAKYWKDKRQ
ncbi:MAG: hypothetical protein UV64_C0007G0016 [Parcubacteria group bacterium GW2011_GWC1_43_11b]|nr:MAG: hypothetical protein UV64_C0007G0016 [Parcubacteria group bacterium GW2011_GWC1_43_11b]